MDLELIEDFDLGDRFGTLHLLSGSYFHKAELSGERSPNNQVLHAFPGTFELFTFPFKIVFHQLTAQDRGCTIMTQTFQLQSGASGFIVEFVPGHFELCFAFDSHIEFLFIECIAFFEPVQFVGRL